MLKQYTNLQVRIAELQAKADSDEGATMVEYGLLVALIAVVVAVGAKLLGEEIDALFDTVTGKI